MPTYVFKCEGCGGAKPFLLQEGEHLAIQDGIQRHCSTCRLMTHWTASLQERRAGADRRTGRDRRIA